MCGDIATIVVKFFDSAVPVVANILSGTGDGAGATVHNA
jgi:hypothetical protein